MKKIPLLAALFLLTLGGIVAQQQTFVLYDASCMMRVKYEQAIAQQPRMDYYAYQVTLANGNKLILETGVEGNVRQNYLPPNYLGCNDPRLNADFADNINGNRAKVFMLIPEGNDYLIQPVTMGAVLAKQGNLLTYVSPLASFQFDTRNVIIGENLAFNNTNAKVFFEGRDGNICGGTYLIRQLMPRNAYPVIDYKINPEIGVIERRLGSDGSTTVGGVVVARTVNMTPVANYLATNCGQIANSGPATYGSTIVPPTGYTPPTSNPVYTQPQLQPTNVNPQTAATNMVATEAPTHEVSKGETLFGLSRRYDVSVEQIREWNNLPGNTINVGQSLRVGPAGFAPVGTNAVVSNTPQANPNTTQPLMVNRGNVANSNVGASQPVPYGGNVAPVPGVPTTTPADQQHIVQAGETVASVALRYGYTEGKFREINGLGANEYLRIGQRLKTSSCDCPANTTPVNSVSQPGIASSPGPATYGGGGVVAPRAFQPVTTPSSIQAGTPVGPTAVTVQSSQNNFRQPVSSPTPQTMSPPAFGSPAPTQFNNRGFVQPQPATRTQPTTTTTNSQPVTRPGSMINNDPGFGSVEPEPEGQVIPQVFRAPAGQSMNALEGGNRSPVIGGGNTNPTAFGSGVNNNTVQNTFSNPNTRSVHVVQQGESLNTIAKRYGLSVAQLRALNDMQRTDVIIPFQRLYIN